MFGCGLVWELEVEDSLGEDEELSSSLSLFIFRLAKRGSLSVLLVRARAGGLGDFGGRLLVDMTDGLSVELTGFIAASFEEEWF